MTMILASSSTFTVPPSQEEDDLLQRSSKKVKNDGNKNRVENVLQGPWPMLGSKGSVYTDGGPTFAEKLKGIDRHSEQAEDDLGGNDEMESEDEISDSPKQSQKEDEEPLCNTTEDPTKNFPTFAFSGKMKKKLYRAWRKAVIVKLLDKGIGYKALQTRLQSMWAKNGVINLIDIGYGFYVVKLLNREDYFNALTGGPWMIYDHYLTVRPWEPKFKPEIATINKVAVWVRMPKIPLEYYDEEALKIIGNRIGETIKVDLNTSCHLRGHFARICVLVDLDKQLMSGFSLEGENYYLEYEGLHMLCTGCGNYGHRVETCSNRGRVPESETKEASVQRVQQEIGQEANKENCNIQDQWRVVQKNRRPRKVKENRTESTRLGNSGSRFGVLADVEAQTQSLNNNGNIQNSGASEDSQLLPRRVKAGRLARGRKKAIFRKKVTAVSRGMSQVHSEKKDEDEEVRKRCEKRSRATRQEESRFSEHLMLTIKACTDDKMEIALGGEKGDDVLQKEGKDGDHVLQNEGNNRQMLDLYLANGPWHDKAQDQTNNIRIEEVDPGDVDFGSMQTSPAPIINEVGDNGDSEMVLETQFLQNI